MSSIQQPVSSMPVVGPREVHGHCAHSVQFYGADERSIAVSVGKYVAEGLQRGQGVLVIATPAHAAAFVRELQLLAIDAGAATDEQRLIFLDAEQTLSSFVIDSQPDELLFQQTIKSALRRLKCLDGMGKRAYGEMVGVLWARNDISAALRLEELWNDLLPSTGLELFCGYPIDVFGEDFPSHAVASVLKSHTHVLPTGADGDLERSLQRAMRDLAPLDLRAPVMHNSPVAGGVVVPKAETMILALNSGMPEHASNVLTRARQYYQTEKRFRALIENSSDAILVMNSEWEILYASPSTSRVLGYSSDEITGRNCLDLLHPEDRENTTRSVADARACARRPIRFEVRVRRSVGSWRWVESTVMDLSDEPSIAGIVWNYRDITERKTAEQALLESERRLAVRERYLQAVLDSMPECVKVLDRSGEVLEMNSAGLRMLEADAPEQVLGRSVYSLIDESSRPAFRSLNESIFDGSPGGSLEFSVTGFKGAHRTFETRVVPLHDEVNRVVGALSATRDITERKAAEAALWRANQELEQFAYAAAHDLQEPIRNVILYTELLALRYRDKLDTQAKEFMEIMAEGAHRMQTLVQDLLAFARSLDNPSDGPPQTDANDVLIEVLENLRTAVQAAGAEIRCVGLPTLPVFRLHLVQLFQNLIANALKYKSEQAPRVEISAEERPDEFVVSVQDNGIGIAPEHRERIFGVFKRLHGRSIPGNGIGLAICHRIVSHYGGRIWVESREDSGSTFFFTLPRGTAGP